MPDLQTDCDVLLVGLGPVGAALANLLGQFGVQVHVIDRATEIFQAPRAIALINDGDMIDIDIPNRTIALRISDEELAKRRAEMEARGAKAWKPVNRDRVVSAALRAYAAMTTSADTGAVRDVSQIEK